MLDALDLRIALQRHGVEAQLAERVEGELERGQAFERGARLDEFVALEDRQAHRVGHRHDRAVEAAVACAPRRRAAGIRSAKASTSSREKPSSVAIRSAPMPCGTKAVSKLVCGSCAQAPPSEPIGTRDMLSTPPATTRSSQPAPPSAPPGSPPRAPRRRSG